MGKIAKDGSFTAKPSTNKAIQRLYENATPLPVYSRNTAVEVYVGAGWSKGVVEFSDSDRCVVFLKIGSRRITCYDSRCIRRLKDQ